MMENNRSHQFYACLAFTVAQEGGYRDPADPGGATNMGITLATLRHWDHDPALAPLMCKT